MSVRNLTLAFFSPGEHDDWVNRLVARASRHPYCHVEIYFETVNQSFSIQYGQKAELRTKTLQSNCYEYVTLGVTLKEYDSCLDYCRKISRSNVVFDDTGMWCSYFYVPSWSSEGKTFCSKVICEALKTAGVEEVMHRVPSFATPSRLYADLVHSKRRVCASVPYKREQMLKQTSVNFQNRVYKRMNGIFM